MLLRSIIPLVLQNAVCGQDGLDQWWYDLGGHDSPASDYIAATSPFYAWFKSAKEQFDAYAPAKHVGMINRGNLLNPELNHPAHHAFGHESDFNVGDLTSEAFSNIPQAQKFVAKKVHVDAGLAMKIGQIVTMPPGVLVQDDGSVLVDTGRQGDPCNPSPCPLMGTPRCVAVSSSTAKCIGPDSKTLELRWIDPLDETGKVITSPFFAGPITLVNQAYDLDLIIVPSLNYDGSACSSQVIASIIGSSSNKCGVLISASKTAQGAVAGKEVAELTTSESDGATFKDYTYAVYARRNSGSPDASVIDESEYNLANVGLKLNYYSDLNGVKLPEFVYKVPQGSVINTGNKRYFFFGCIRPNIVHQKAIDTRGAGFYNLGDVVRSTGKQILDSTLCDSLQNVLPAITPGFQ